MNKKKVFSLVRHILTFGAGWLVSKGKLDPTEAESIVGGLMMLGGGLWGYHKPEAKAEGPGFKGFPSG